MIKNFVECGVGVDVGAVYVGFVNDMSSQVGEDDKWVVFREVRDI